MFLIAFRKGGVKCSSACPFYTETGKVTGVRGVPLKTHCRMTMNPWMVDCDIYNPCNIHKVEVSEEEFRTMLKAVKKRAIKQRKLYPEEHEEIHAVGCEWTRSKGRWNSEKSRLVQKDQNDPKMRNTILSRKGTITSASMNETTCRIISGVNERNF